MIEILCIAMMLVIYWVATSLSYRQGFEEGRSFARTEVSNRGLQWKLLDDVGENIRD